MLLTMHGGVSAQTIMFRLWDTNSLHEKCAPTRAKALPRIVAGTLRFIAAKGVL